MFRLDRRIRSASSKFKKLENSAELALAKAQQTATRTLSLRSRSRSAHRNEQAQDEQPNEGESSNTLLGLLSPRNWANNNNGTQKTDRPKFDLDDTQEEIGEEAADYDAETVR